MIGIQGLAPHWFEIDAAAFLSSSGDVTGRIEAEYDLRITQRLILQPKVELEWALQDVPELRIGSGLSSAEAGLRLRYEIVPEFAPMWASPMSGRSATPRASRARLAMILAAGGCCPGSGFGSEALPREHHQ